MSAPAGGEDRRRFRARRDVRFRTVGEEGVLVRQEAGEVLVVNEVGARVIALLDGERTVGELLATLAEEFDVAPEQLRRDVAEYLEQLVAAGVLEGAG